MKNTLLATSFQPDSKPRSIVETIETLSQPYLWMLASALALVFIGLLYGRILSYGYLYEDGDMLNWAVVHNPFVFFTKRIYVSLVSLRPFAVIAAWLGAKLFGNTPMGLHAASLLYMFINLMVLFACLKKVSGSATVGLLGMVFYPLHFGNRHDVLSVSSQMNSVYSIFFLLAFVAFLSSLEERRKIFHVSLSLFLMTMAFFTFESAVVFPLIVIAYLRIIKNWDWHQSLKESLPYWLWVAALLVYRAHLLGATMGGHAHTIQGLNGIQIAELSFVNWANEFWEAFWVWEFPNKFASEGRWRALGLFGMPVDPYNTRHFLIALTLTLAFLGISCVTMRKIPKENLLEVEPLVFFGFVWTFINCLPFFVQAAERHSFARVPGAFLVFATLFYAGQRYARNTFLKRCQLLALVLVTSHSSFRVLYAPYFQLSGFGKLPVFLRILN